MRFLRSLALFFSLAVAALAQDATPATAPTAAPAPDPVEGAWVGTVTTPEGEAIDFGLKFNRAKGGFGVSVYLPAMSSYGQLGSFATFKDGVYDFSSLPGLAQLEGDVLTGSVGFIKLPFRLTRAADFPRTAAKKIPDWPKGPAPLWTVPLGGRVWNSPVARDGVVYVAASTGGLHAIRSTDGSTVWQWTGPAPFYGTPAVTEDALYAVSERHELFKLDRATGAKLWSVVLDAERHAAAEAPADNTFIRRTPTPVIADGVVYVGAGDKKFRALRASDGGELWSFMMEGRNYSPALVTADRVIVGDFRGQLYALERAGGRELWRTKFLGPVSTQPVLVGDTLVIGSRDYVCYGLDAATGATKWSRQFWLSWVESAPAVADGTLYIGSSDYARVQAMDPHTGRTLWLREVFGPVTSTPQVVGDTVYVGAVGAQINQTRIHDGGIVALDRRTGEVRWRIEAFPVSDGPTFGYPGNLIVLGDRLLAAGYDGALTAYPLR